MFTIYSIPIYRLSEIQFQKERENHYRKFLDPFNKGGKEELIRWFINRRSYDWEYNEIIGYLEIDINETIVEFNYNFRKGKIIRKGCSRKFGNTDYVNGVYMDLNYYDSSIKFSESILECIQNEICSRPEFSKWYLDIEKFKIISKHLDWMRLKDI